MAPNAGRQINPHVFPRNPHSKKYMALKRGKGRSEGAILAAVALGAPSTPNFCDNEQQILPQFTRFFRHKDCGERAGYSTNVAPKITFECPKRFYFQPRPGVTRRAGKRQRFGGMAGNENENGDDSIWGHAAIFVGMFLHLRVSEQATLFSAVFPDKRQTNH